MEPLKITLLELPYLSMTARSVFINLTEVEGLDPDLVLELLPLLLPEGADLYEFPTD